MNYDSEIAEDATAEQRILRELSEDELREILAQHHRWLQSKGKEGKRAVLRRADLQGAVLGGANFQQGDLKHINFQGAVLGGANFRGASLAHANLRGASLGRADLQGARLVNANLQGAYLVGATFEGRKGVEKGEFTIEGADLAGADLGDADLSDAKLSAVTGLLPDKLAGACLSNAKLPEDIAKFDGLAQVEEISKNARKIFLAMLLGCVYSWLTIATTTDARLLTNSASSPLPIIQAEIPVAGFYWAAPLILLSIYVYFQFYLQRLWEGLAKLPAVFPDGRPLHDRAYPWLLNGLVRPHFQRLRGERTVISRLENLVSIGLAYWVVPSTLFLFWGRYLSRHDWSGTVLHILLLVGSVGAAIMLHRLAVRTLRRTAAEFLWRKPWADSRTYQVAVVLVIGAIFAPISIGAINGVPGWVNERPPADLPIQEGPRTWVPRAFEFFGYKTYADLREAVVSTRPENWWNADGEHKKIETIKGAGLRDINLQYADAVSAFLVKADLRNSILRGVDFHYADLRGADLTDAIFENTDFGYANLQGADIGFSRLKKVKFYNSNLQDIIFRFVDFSESDLQGANLSNADLENSWGFTQEMLNSACGNDTILPENFSIKACPSK